MDAAEVGLDVVAARNPSIEAVTKEVVDGVSAPAHAVTMEPTPGSITWSGWMADWPTRSSMPGQNGWRDRAIPNKGKRGANIAPRCMSGGCLAELCLDTAAQAARLD